MAKRLWLAIGAMSACVVQADIAQDFAEMKKSAIFLTDTDYAGNSSVPDGIPNSVESASGGCAWNAAVHDATIMDGARVLGLKTMSFTLETNVQNIYAYGSEQERESPLNFHFAGEALVHISDIQEVQTPANFEFLSNNHPLLTPCRNLPDDIWLQDVTDREFLIVRRTFSYGKPWIVVDIGTHFSSYTGAGVPANLTMTKSFKIKAFRGQLAAPTVLNNLLPGMECNVTVENDAYVVEVTVTNGEGLVSDNIELAFELSPNIPELIVEPEESPIERLACSSQNIALNMDPNSFPGEKGFIIMPQTPNGPRFALNNQQELVASEIPGGSLEIIPGSVGGDYKVYIFARNYWRHYETVEFRVGQLVGLQQQNLGNGIAPGDCYEIKPVWKPENYNPPPVTFSHTVLPVAAGGDIPVIGYSSIVDGNYLVCVPLNSPDGKLQVNCEVTGALANGCSKTNSVFKIGCECDTDCAKAGEANALLSSIDIRFPLGPAMGGRSAGELCLKSSHMNASLVNPSTLSVNLLTQDVEVIHGSNGTRQVLTPQHLIEVAAVSPFAFTVSYYHHTALGDEKVRLVDGLYARTAEPHFKQWLVRNPNESNQNVSTLELLKNPGVAQTIRRYHHDPVGDVWTLTEGISGSEPDGLRRTVVQKAVEVDTLVETVSVLNPDNSLASKRKSSYVTNPTGGRALKRLETYVSASQSIVTEFEYDVNGRRIQEVSSTGHWVTYDYDSWGRLISVVKPWLDDDTPSHPPSSSHQTLYSYTTVSQNIESIRPGILYKPRKITESCEGIVVRQEMFEYTDVEFDGNPDCLKVVHERAHSATATFGDPLNRRTESIYYPDDYPSDSIFYRGNAGKIASYLSPDQVLEQHYYYTTALIDGSSNPANWIHWPANESEDSLELIVTGTAEHPFGIHDQTLWTAVVRDRLGRERLSEQYVYNEAWTPPSGDDRPDFAGAQSPLKSRRILWSAVKLNSNGQAEMTAQSDGRQTDKQYSCCGLEYVRDEEGMETRYTYDDLERVKTETLYDFPQTGENLVSLFTYDAVNRTLVRETQSMGKSVSTSAEYDLTGRILSRSDEAGRSELIEYDDTARIVTRTPPPSGSAAARPTTSIQYYTDGREKKITTQGAVTRHNLYEVSSGGEVTQKLVYAEEPSGVRWNRTTLDFLGRTTNTESSSSENRVYKQVVEYDGAKNLIRKLTGFWKPEGASAFASDTMGSIMYGYDLQNHPSSVTIDMNSNGAVDLDGLDRTFTTSRHYEMKEGAWYRTLSRSVYATLNSPVATNIARASSRLTGLGVSGKILEETAADIRTNNTTKTVSINRNSRTRTETTDYPESSINEVNVFIGGLLRTSQNKLGLVKSYQYGSFGQVLSVSDPIEGLNQFTYTDDGRLLTSIDAYGKTSQYTYDPVTQQLICIENPMGEKQRLDYDAFGRKTKVFGGGVHPTWIEFDEFGRKNKLHTYRDVGADFSGSTWPSDAGAGDVTQWNYDPRSGWLSSKVDAAGKSVSYSYFPQGLLKTRTLARTLNSQSIVATYGYNQAGDLSSVDYSDATPDLTYHYFRDGALSGVVDLLGLRSFTRNSSTLEPMDEIVPASAVYPAIVLTRTYQDVSGSGNVLPGRLDSISTSKNYYQAFSYDAMGRLDAINSAAESFAYDFVEGSSLVDTVTSTKIGGSTMTRAYGRGVDSRLESVLNQSSLWTNSTVNTTFDDAGRILQSARVNADTWNYTYNNKGEVAYTQKRRGTTPFPGLTFTYEYDEVGNPKKMDFAGDAQGANLIPALYAHSSVNEMISVSKTDPIEFRGEDWFNDITINLNGVPAQRLGEYYRLPIEAANTVNAVRLAVGMQIVKGPSWPANLFFQDKIYVFYVPKEPEVLIYDLDGNVTRDGRWDYTWDAENRLIKLETRTDLPTTFPRQRVSFSYDYLNRRVRKVVEAKSGSVWSITSDSRFVWDGWRLLQEVNSGGQVTREFVWGLDLGGALESVGTIGGLLSYRALSPAAPASAWSAWPAYDGNGNVSGLFDTSTGAMLADYEYDAFGNSIKAIGTKANQNPWRFSTKWTDGETGHLYYGYRYYMPSKGRWLSRDPIGEAGGLNLYGMVGNNPVNYVDPMGLWGERYRDFDIDYNADTGMVLVQPRMQDWWDNASDLSDWQDNGCASWRPATALERDHWGRYRSGDVSGARIASVAQNMDPARVAKDLAVIQAGILAGVVAPQALAAYGVESTAALAAASSVAGSGAAELTSGAVGDDMSLERFGVNTAVGFAGGYAMGKLLAPLLRRLAPPLAEYRPQYRPTNWRPKCSCPAPAAANSAPVLRFTQTTASPWFHPEGKFAGLTISDVAAQLRAGTLKIADVPVTVVGDSLIVNTRSSLALRQAGIPQSQWRIIPGTAQDAADIAARLSHNSLGPTGTDVIRITGSGSGSSTWIGSGTIPPPVP